MDGVQGCPGPGPPASPASPARQPDIQSVQSRVDQGILGSPASPCNGNLPRTSQDEPARGSAGHPGLQGGGVLGGLYLRMGGRRRGAYRPGSSRRCRALQGHRSRRGAVRSTRTTTWPW